MRASELKTGDRVYLEGCPEVGVVRVKKMIAGEMLIWVQIGVTDGHWYSPTRMSKTKEVAV